MWRFPCSCRRGFLNSLVSRGQGLRPHWSPEFFRLLYNNYFKSEDHSLIWFHVHISIYDSLKYHFIPCFLLLWTWIKRQVVLLRVCSVLLEWEYYKIYSLESRHIWNHKHVIPEKLQPNWLLENCAAKLNLGPPRINPAGCQWVDLKKTNITWILPGKTIHIELLEIFGISRIQTWFISFLKFQSFSILAILNFR